MLMLIPAKWEKVIIMENFCKKDVHKKSFFSL